jgi:hypothetical protein
MPRLRLRAPEPADLDIEHDWLPEALAAVQGRGTPRVAAASLESALLWLDQSYPPGTSLVALDQSGEVVGLTRARCGGTGPLIFDVLTVRADRRNVGYGHEIVAEVEATLGSESTYGAAAVPRSNGLAVYFWLRVGYHPLTLAELEHHLELDVAPLWMVRRPAPAG